MLCPQVRYLLQEKAVTEQRKSPADPTAPPGLVPPPIHPSYPRQARSCRHNSWFEVFIWYPGKHPHVEHISAHPMPAPWLSPSCPPAPSLMSTAEDRPGREQGTQPPAGPALGTWGGHRAGGGCCFLVELMGTELPGSG